MNINALNDDCLSAIFGFVPLTDLVRDRRVCKLWRQTIDDYFGAERHLVYDLDMNRRKRDQYFYKYKTKDNIESLLNLDRFERCVQLMPRLLALTLKGVKANDAMLPILANNCPNLCRLHCLSGEESLTFVGLRYLVAKYPTLTRLDLPNCQLDDDLIHIIATNLQQLVHFNFATDRSRHTRSSRLSRFTGQTLSEMGPKVRTLMVGESMYWDESLITSLTDSSFTKHVTVLKLHLIKLKALKTICEQMGQLKELYLSFNGGDINSQQNNVGCIKHLSKLHELEVVELVDDGRHHCAINGCQSVYTLTSMIDAVKGMPRLRVLRLLDYDNWHSNKPCIDHCLSMLKQTCPRLTELGISAGLFQLKTESYGLIGMLGLTRLTLQGDTSLTELPGHSSKQDYLTGQVLQDMVQNSQSLRALRVDNCRQLNAESVTKMIEIVGERQAKNRAKKYQFVLHLHNTRLDHCNQDTLAKVNCNVKVVLTRDEEENPFDNYSDDSSWDSTDSESIHLWPNSDHELEINIDDEDDDDDEDNEDIIIDEFFE